MKSPETTPQQSIFSQLQLLESSMQSLINELSPAERLNYLNGMITRMYTSGRQPVSSPEKIKLVLAHRKGSTLTSEQKEKIRLLSDLTNQLYGRLEDRKKD